MIILKPESTREYYGIIRYHKTVNEPFLGIGVTNELTVYYTGKDDMNIDAINNLNAFVIPYVSNGGTAISQPGDLSVYLGIPGRHSGWCIYVYKALQRIFATEGIYAEIERNDFTIQGKKVMGYTEHVDNVYSSGSIFIAMNNSSELIDLICLKPKTRNAAGLSDYGISTEELIEHIELITKDYLKVKGVE